MLCALSAVAQQASRPGRGGTVAAGTSKKTHIKQDKEAYFLSGRVPREGDAASAVAAGQAQRKAMRAARESRAQRVRRTKAEEAVGEGSGARRESALGSGQAALVEEQSAFTNLTWQSLGPAAIESDITGLQSYGKVSGRVTAIAVDQKDPSGNTVFIGTANGGVWKSSNAANPNVSSVTWAPLTDDQASLSIGSLAIQPGGNVILAGTGEPNSSTYSYYGQGILHSADNGVTWSLISTADAGATSLRGLGFGRIAFKNADVVVAAAGGTPGSLRGAETSGSAARTLYVSGNSGQSWTKAVITDTTTNDVQPFSATAVVYSAAHGKFYAAMRYHGFYSSADGLNWTRMTNQPESTPGALSLGMCPSATSSACPMYRADMSVAADGAVYAVWVDANSNSTGVGGGIFRLESNGTWTTLSQASLDDCGDVDGCGLQQATYNLTIQAVPNGLATDLYVGAVNIFKCTIINGSTCAETGAWKNLTHAYGCESTGAFGAPAHVHPAQHAAGFGGANAQTVYFGNDGGVYRTLTAASLNSSSCTVANPFQNLNENLGSLAQVVDFSNHPTDSQTILSGVQDTGSPAFNGSGWFAVNGGDGGYNAIDPASPSTFYTSFDGVGVYRCVSGVNCAQNTWTSVLSAEDVGGDTSAFYMPWMLDPQKPTALVAGTCRVWRGLPGSGFTALSKNLSTHDDASCVDGTLSGDTKIRSLASGGAFSANGSQVIYAGMVGFAMPSAGKVFVTTNADSGAGSWVDRTGDINPFAYDVADIAISPHDASGNTAYVAIMGFGGGHIYKTADAGQNWADKSGDLPDVPVNALIVDPVNPQQLYAGTDVGVFISTDDGASWTEVGSGLPNVAVTKLKIFGTGTERKLRAGTFGRGIWEIPLPGSGVSAAASAPAAIAVVGRSVDAGTVTMTNNLASPVTITGVSGTGDFAVTSNSCTGVLGAGASCSVGIAFTPTAGGVRNGSVVVTHNGPNGSSSASVQGTGVDFGVRVGRGVRPLRGGGSSAAIEPGQSASFEVETSVAGAPGASGVTVPLEFACENAPAKVQCVVETSRAELAPGESRRVQVRLMVQGRARKSARLRNSVRPGVYYVTFVAKTGEESRSVPVGFTVK